MKPACRYLQGNNRSGFVRGAFTHEFLILSTNNQSWQYVGDFDRAVRRIDKWCREFVGVQDRDWRRENIYYFLRDYDHAFAFRMRWC